MKHHDCQFAFDFAEQLVVFTFFDYFVESLNNVLFILLLLLPFQGVYNGIENLLLIFETEK
jgi:hypothetical protein